jgi:membrane associated rhomboid family serine protease
MNSHRSGSLRIPGYNENAALQLVAATGLFFIMFFASWVTMVVFSVPKEVAQARVHLVVGLAPVSEYLRYPWTVLTYGLPHAGFWDWISNAIWLYTFASVVQSLVGFRQVIPIYLYGLLLGGIFCLGAQLIPGIPPLSFRFTGGFSGVLAMATAAVTLAPRYRFYLGGNLGIPLVIPAVLFLILSLFNATSHQSGDVLPLFALYLGGMIAGFGTVKLLRRGYKPGAWVYGISDSINRISNPDLKRQSKLRAQRLRAEQLKARQQAERENSQNRVDEILDKINQGGYNSLTPDEREILMKASKEAQN